MDPKKSKGLLRKGVGIFGILWLIAALFLAFFVMAFSRGAISPRVLLALTIPALWLIFWGFRHTAEPAVPAPRKSLAKPYRITAPRNHKHLKAPPQLMLEHGLKRPDRPSDT